MAWTVTKKDEACNGNRRICIYDVTADSATALVTAAGLKNVIGFTIGHQSVATTSRIRGYLTSNTISFICAASGDVFTLVCYGN